MQSSETRTVTYKGLQIERSLLQIIGYMQDVETYREQMSSLQGAWDTLALLGQLTGSATGISHTRESFHQLTELLLNQLGMELLKKSRALLRTQAQNAIDILVRNLFERTADIGFLSQDLSVQAFFSGSSTPDSADHSQWDEGTPSSPAVESSDLLALRERLRAYVSKYTVYDDVMLVNASGKVLLALDRSREGRSLSRALVTRSLGSTGFVESYGVEPDLGASPQLLYSIRVGSAGILVLEFGLDSEVAAIYEGLHLAEEWTEVILLDDQRRVVTSSSEILFPRGCSVPTLQGQLLRFGGRIYVAETCSARPYQEYPGPGWTALAVIPAEQAFASSLADFGDEGDMGAAIEALMQVSGLFSALLLEIPKRAQSIQLDLNRTVWNGSVALQPGAGEQASGHHSMGNADFAKILLWEISNAGRKMKAVFDQAIGNLHHTILNTLKSDLVGRARLAVDLLDRNLYERANDVRWWCLDARLQSAFRGPEALEQARSVLSSIHALYTVYDRLVLFSADGHIVASSVPDDELVGAAVPELWLQRTRGLRDEQHYAVSPFESTALYGDRPSYAYLGALRDAGQWVGGLAIVFDSEPQFQSMLQDVLPVSEREEVVSGLFVQTDATTISQAGAAHAAIQEEALRLADGLTPGESRVEVRVVGDRTLCMAVAQTAGYREFNRVDSYRNPVVACMTWDLGPALNTDSASSRSVSSANHQSRELARTEGSRVVDMASFMIGGLWFGVRTEHVSEAIDLRGLSPSALERTGLLRGFKMHKGQLLTVISLHEALGLPTSSLEPSAAQIIILNDEHHTGVGVLVDELCGIPRVDLDELEPPVAHRTDQPGLTEGVIGNVEREPGELDILTVLSVPQVFRLM